MRIIAVDDEKIALEALSGAIRAIVAEDEVVSFLLFCRLHLTGDRGFWKGKA